MHGMVIDDEYPFEAVGGCDFFTRAARGEIAEDGPDGPVVRMEKVLITDRYVDMEDTIVGQICIGERTARHFAHQFGLVDGWKVQRIIDDNRALRTELVDLSKKVAEQARHIAILEELERAPAEKLWLALDGTEHASRRGCQEATAKMIGSDLKILEQAVPPPAPAEEVTP